MLLGLHHDAVMLVSGATSPHVIDPSVAKFLQSRASPPGALLLMRLEQASMYARVHTSGDEGLDLQAFASQGVLVVPIAIIRGDASSVPKGGWADPA